MARILLLTSGTSPLGMRLVQRYVKAGSEWSVSSDAVIPTGYDLALSAGYRHIVRQDVLDRLPILNLHTGYLPYNRGSYPNVWPFLDNSPAGVTLHWMDAGIDTGPIIERRRVELRPWDTAESLYARLTEAAYTLFVEWWTTVSLDGLPAGTPQAGPFTVHKKADFFAIGRDSLETGFSCVHESTPDELLNELRACSFTGHRGLKIYIDDVAVEATVTLKPWGDDDE